MVNVFGRFYELFQIAILIVFAVCFKVYSNGEGRKRKDKNKFYFIILGMLLLSLLSFLNMTFAIQYMYINGVSLTYIAIFILTFLLIGYVAAYVVNDRKKRHDRARQIGKWKSKDEK